MDDEHDCYIPHEDEWYFGRIPDDCDQKNLIKIMVNALLKFQKDKFLWTGRDESFDDLVDVVNLWFDNDSNRRDTFNYLVMPEERDDFVRDIVNKVLTK